MTVSAPLIQSIGFRSAMVNPSEVGVTASPQTPISYGASASSRILAKTEGRRPNACTATARSRTNVPPSTIIATRWRANAASLAGSVGRMAFSVVPQTARPGQYRAWNPTPSSSSTASGSRRGAGRTGSPTTRRRGTGSSRPATRASRSRSRRCATNPQIIVDVTVPAIIDKIEAIIRALDRRRSSWGTPPAARSPRSCSTTASARPAWR